MMHLKRFGSNFCKRKDPSRPSVGTLPRITSADQISAFRRPCSICTSYGDENEYSNPLDSICNGDTNQVRRAPFYLSKRLEQQLLLMRENLHRCSNRSHQNELNDALSCIPRTSVFDALGCSRGVGMRCKRWENTTVFPLPTGRLTICRRCPSLRNFSRHTSMHSCW
jgi:hypothetical protein